MKGKPIHCWQRDKLVQPFWKAFEIPKPENYWSFDSIIPLLGAYSEEIILKEGKTLYTQRYSLWGKSTVVNNKNWKHSNVKQQEIAKEIKLYGKTVEIKIWKH